MSKEAKFIRNIVVWSVLFIMFLIFNPLVKIDSGERGVILKFGEVQENILEEGLHFIMPVLNTVKKMDVTTQKEERGASASSKDLQIVTSEVAINYHLDPLKVNKLYQELRRDYSDRVITPAIQEFIKKITAQYTAEELITKRENVKEQLRVALTDNLSKNGIVVDDIFITNFDFSDEFNKSIEAKVTAEQRALEEKNKTVQIEEQAKQKVVSAEADARAIQIQAQAINSQGGEDYVNLKAIEKWNGILPVQMIPGSTVPFIQLSK